MNILISGFEAFGGEKMNPSWEAVKALPSSIGETAINKICLPCVFFDAGDVLKKEIERVKPDFVLCIGQAGGRSDISLEKVAINLMDGRIADNSGFQPVDCSIVQNASLGYFTNLPIKAMAQKIKDAGIPASISYSAGTYVCNYIFYYLMYLIDTSYKNIKGGFIHIPYDVAQAANKLLGTPTMSKDTVVKAITVALEYLINDGQEISVNAGRIC